MTQKANGPARPVFDDAATRATLEAAMSGNHVAFTTLFETHYDLIYRIAFKHSRDPDHAADIAQETCIKLARKLDTYRFDAKFSTWLYRLTINTAKDWHSKACRRHESSWPEGFDVAVTAPTPERQTSTRELLGLVERLPRKLKDAVLLVFRDGLSHRQAASALGCAETTISWRIHEARKALASLSMSQIDERPDHA